MPVEIADWNDLDNVRNDLTGDYVLVNDLDSETTGYSGVGDDWNPIGEQAIDGDFYEGDFDGDGFEIRDLIVDSTERNVGLFSGIRSPGEIKNLSVVGDITTTSDSNAGAVLCSENRGLIQNCVCGGSVTALSLSRVGGLVGLNLTTVTDSYATASIDGEDQVGGLVGINIGTIIDSYAIGSVDGDEEVAGLVGRNNDTISTSYAAAPVTGNTDVGGLCTDSFDNGVVTDSYWDTEVSGQDTSGRDDGTEGGTGLTTDEMQGSEAETNMDGFDFSDTWNTVLDSDADTTDDGYPILLAVNRDDQLDAQGILNPFILSVQTNAATDIGNFDATLNGELVELDAEATDADVFFEFGETVGQNQTPTQTLTEPATFDELIDELEPNTTFEFRAVAEAQNEENETFTDQGDTLTFDTEIVTVDGTITLDETGAENADVIVYNLTQDTFEGRLSTDANGDYSVDLPDANREDIVAVAVDFADGLERYGRLITTVIE